MASKRKNKRNVKAAASAATRTTKKKVCQFCKDKADYIAYKDVSLLRRFTTDRGKIRARRVTGNCSGHQRSVAVAVRNARERGLWTYTTCGKSRWRGGAT